MTIGKSNINPLFIEPFEAKAEDAYDDAENGKKINTVLIKEEDIKIYDDENHYIKFQFYDGSGKANVYLEWDDKDIDIDLYVFTRDGLKVAYDVESNDKVTASGNKYILLHSIDVNQDQDYMVGMRAYGSGSTRYTLKVKLYDDTDDYETMLRNTGLDDEGVKLPSNYEFVSFYEEDDRRELLGSGHRGTDVTFLQRALYLISDNYYDKDEIDGKFGYNTRKAVKKLQSDWNIAVDGIVGPETRNVIYQAIRWKRYGAYQRRKSMYVAAIEAGGFARAFKIDIPSVSALYEDYYEYGPFYTPYAKVTYKVGANLAPKPGMIVLSTNSSGSGKINLYNAIEANVTDNDIKATLIPLKSLVETFEVDESSTIYISANFPKVSIGNSNFELEGPSLKIGMKRKNYIDIAGDTYKFEVYEEIILEPKAYNSSNNTAQYNYNNAKYDMKNLASTPKAIVAFIIAVITASSKKWFNPSPNGFNFCMPKDILDDIINKSYDYSI